MNSGRTLASISALAVDSRDRLTVYAGTGFPYSNGPHSIFRSRTGGATWTGVITGLPGAGVWTLLVHPRDVEVVYAITTGDGGVASVLRSGDAGANWTAVTPLSRSGSVRALALDPGDSSILYAANGDILKSTDAGATWAVVLRGGRFVAAALSQPPTIYASVPETGTDGLFRIHKSINGGNDWTSAGSFLLDETVALTVDPTDAETVYASYEGLWKSTDGGMTWTDIGASLPTAASLPVIDPTDPSKLYVGTLRGVFKSTDGGTTWHPMGAK